MDALNEPDIETVVIMSSAQVGKTEFLLNIIGYHVDQDPSPMLLLQPTLEMAETFSKDRLAPMVRDTPALNGKIKDPRARDSGNTLLKKNFPGGHITMAGANSPASLASRPIRVVLCDEVDRYPPSAGSEGDPVNLARKRTTTFWNRKVVLTSTPTVKGISRIERAYEDSDQRKYYVPCPHCQATQPLKWSNIIFDKADLSRVVYACDHCGTEIEENQKFRMLARGEWVAESESHKTAGFHLNELYSPWRKWRDVVEDFLAAKDNQETLKTWVNTSLGETWEEAAEKVDENSLYSRREDYDTPNEVLVITAGIDVQDDRLELELVGWGEGKESWGLDYRVIYGDPGLPQVWRDLDQALSLQFTTDDGRKLGISAACIDTGGHYTQITYEYVKPRQVRRIYGIKGVGGEGRPIVSAPSKKKTGHQKKAIDLFTVGTDQAKSIIYAWLKQTETGPGYCHFPLHYNEEYFKQLAAEKVVTKYRKGFAYREWVKTRPRNEALDCRQYALAALEILNPVWSALKNKPKPKPVVQPPPTNDWINQGSDWI